MEEVGIDTAFAFDKHFAQAGFKKARIQVVSAIFCSLKNTCCGVL
jgi:hypothetical protein